MLDEPNVVYCRDILGVVSLMYRRRLHRLCDWWSSLERIQTAEHHIENELGRLEAEGRDALDLAVEDASADDPGSYFAAMSLACQMMRFEVVRDILVGLETVCANTSTDEHAAASLRYAVATALVRFLPLCQAELVMEMLPEATPHVLPVLATWLGTVGEARATEQLQEAAGQPCADPAAVLRALGRMPGPAPRVVLNAVDDPDPRVAQTAAVAALRRGDESVLDRLMSMPHAPWTALPVAMGGGPDIGPWLVEATTREDPSQALLALGIHGDGCHLDVLLEHLTVEEHANAAALGLYVLVGAQLNNSAAEETTLDEPTEIGAGRAWASLRESPIKTDPAAWASWFELHHTPVREARRNRWAGLTMPTLDVQTLRWPLPLWLRRCFADEIVIRYGGPQSFEPDLWIDWQRRLIGARWRELERKPGRRSSGTWHFQGRELESSRPSMAMGHRGERSTT